MKKEKLIIEGDHKHISLIITILNKIYHGAEIVTFKPEKFGSVIIPRFYFRGSVKWKRPYFQKRKLMKEFREKGLNAKEVLKKYKEQYWL